MKKLSLLIIFFLAVCITAIAGRIEKIYSFSNYTLGTQGNYQTIRFENTLLTGLPGQPVLPYSQVKILLPPGESVDRLEVSGMDAVEIPGIYQLLPQQNVQPVSKGPSGIFIRDTEVYSKNAAYPAALSGHIVTAFLNGHSFALSTFTPVQYNPATGSLSYYSKVKVTVYTKTTDDALAALKNLKQTSQIVNEINNFSDNPEMLSSYAADNSTSVDDYEILIVTTPAFTGSFESLRTNYLTEGLRSQVVSTDLISQSMTGVDLQEKIRNFIIQEYQQHGIQHVVLGGDDEFIPHRGFWCQVQSSSLYEDSNIPADLYYSALDGNWNTNGNNLWAEPGEDDLLPDISVGRLTFKTETELQSMLHKSVSYQFSPVAGEFQKVLLAGENLYNSPMTWGSDYLNLLIGLHSDNGYTTSGIPATFSLNEMYDENANWTGNDLINTLNQGYPFLDHVGHANETYVMKLYNTDITDARFYNVNGIVHNYAVVYTHGCMCGSFDYPYDDCIAERIVKINNFAAAFVGNSRYGWFNEGTTEGPSAHLNREFTDALYADKLNRIGRAHMESKIATAPWVTAPGQWEPGALRWCFYDCNVLGDPAMAIWTNNAISITTTYPASIPEGSTSMDVNVKSAGFGVNGLSCVLLTGGVYQGKGITDAQGNASLAFDSPLTHGAADLVVSGYNCLPTTYSVTITGNTGIAENQPPSSGLTVAVNPVTDQLKLNYQIPVSETVSISVTAADGKTIILKQAGMEMAGSHSFTFDASSFSPGVYLCSLRSGKNLMNTSFIRK